jgi:glutaredoxin 3
MSAITVYHKDYCPYCKAARQMLDEQGLEYELIEVTHDPAAFSEMLTRSNRRTVPQIFFGDQHIGGFDDLQEYFLSRGNNAVMSQPIDEGAVRATA